MYTVIWGTLAMEEAGRLIPRGEVRIVEIALVFSANVIVCFCFSLGDFQLRDRCYCRRKG